MARQMTIRGIPDDVAEKLLHLSRRHDQSVNTTVIEILRQAVGSDTRRKRLARYATWTVDDLAQVEEAVAAQRWIDESQWL
jgi:plasmid stability protein